MKFTSHFIKTKRTVDQEIESVNGRLLTQGGFIHQEVAGAYSYLPLGLRVLNNIEAIIRKHMDTIASEIFMTSLHPRSIWETTERIDTVDVLMETQGANKLSKEKNSTSYILGSTHEEMVTPLVQSFTQSYRELPMYVYQIQTKFRNEARAKSGLLRGREFRMKDLYSFSRSQAELMEYYEVAKKVYMDIYQELGIGSDTFVTLASGGDFTKDFSHEFQVLLESGEDTIYLDRANNIAYNKEVVNEENSQKLGVDFAKLEEVKASEVGNIFPLGTKFSKAFGFTYTDDAGKEDLVWMGSYGIGPSRLMGVLVEKFHDDKGMAWPENVAPYKYHLVTLAKTTDDESYKASLELYEKLKGQVLWDDRFEARMGEKLNDADLIGCPVRLVISEKSLAAGGVELKMRSESEAKIVPITSVV